MSPSNLRILNISLDRSMLAADSPVVKRIIGYSKLSEFYTVLTPAEKNQEVKINNNLKIVGVGFKNKIIGLGKIFLAANKLIRDDKCNLISVQDQYYLGLVGLLLARKYKIGLEIQVHGIEKYGGLRKIVAHYILPRADAVRTVSGRLKRYLLDSKVDESKITVVPVYAGEIKTIKDKEYNLKNPAVILTICRLVPVKNIELQLRALADLKKENLAVELWIVGGGPKKKKLKELSHELNLEPYVKFWGWQKDIENFYNQADLFLLTSYAEGWPLVIVEAAQYGLPIIMTDVGSAGELIVNNESGLIIPVNDQNALTQSIKTLLADQNLRKKLGKTAQQKTGEQLTWQQILGLYKNSWDKAIANAKLSNNKKQ